LLFAETNDSFIKRTFQKNAFVAKKLFGKGNSFNLLRNSRFICYEKEHYDLSVKIGEMVLFPALYAAEEKILISAPGTSCRHHIKDGTGKQAKHPVEILYEAILGHVLS
jgi:Fe-S oxidoreductase